MVLSQTQFTMKAFRTILYITLLLVVAGCENSYTFTETVFDTILGERTKDPVVIKAKDDSTAFVRACERFNSDLSMYVEIAKDVPSYSKPVGFELKNHEGKTVYYDAIKKYYEGIAVRATPPEENLKVYGGTLFGMSMQEVQSVEHFKEHSWSQFTDLLYTRDKVGGITYELCFRFHNDELLSLCFLDGVYAWSQYEVIQQQVKTLYNIFLEAYGGPSVDRGFPAKSSLYYGEESTIYKWVMWGKEVYITVGRHRERDLYNFRAYIMNPERNAQRARDEERKAEEAERAEREKAAEDAKLF